ncbi:hypothetical protein Tco_1017324 [Tanacetum coccineum]|uniref:Uncharacterized protein n=1 Tax=Tanacetum coccineum TaxID=301880 RepID=A0ABQ5FRM9_9ASTR
MKDVFVSMKNDLDETFKQNKLLKDQLLEASLTGDIKNLVITSCVEIRIKNLHDEIERILKESKDVSTESITTDTVCNDAFKVTQELSKRIVELEKDLSKFEAKSIAFEVALQHKSRENNSLKTLQKENENFMASLQIENAHLKQTYKDLFESIEFFKKKQLDISELNKESGEKRNIFENKISVSQIKIDELEKSLAKQIKENSDLLIKIDNLENVFADEEKRATLGKLNAFDKENCDFESKVIDLKKIIAQKSKDFDDVNLELSNRTAKFEVYFEKLENMKVVLERQLARKSVKTKFDKSSILGKPPAEKLLITSQPSESWFTPKVDVQKSLSKPVTAQSLPKNEKDQLLKRIAYLESKLASQDIRSCQREYHELRTSYNALKVKFDSLNRKKRKINVSNSSKPKVSVSEKGHMGESSKQFSRRVSQFTTYSLQKDRKFSKKSQSFETLTPQKGFKTRASNAKNQSFETSHSRFTPVKQVWRSIKESQTFKTSTFQKSFKTRTLKGKNQVFVTPHSRFTPVKQVWRPKQSHSKSFKYSKSKMLSMQNKNDSVSTINKKGRFSNDAKTNF